MSANNSKYPERSRPYYMEDKILQSDVNPGSNYTFYLVPDDYIYEEVMKLLDELELDGIDFSVSGGHVEIPLDEEDFDLIQTIENKVKTLNGVKDVEVIDLDSLKEDPMARKNTPLSKEKILGPLTSFKNEMNEFFDKFTKEIFPSSEKQDFMPKIEVRDNGNAYLIMAELPGVREDDIDLTAQENTLILEGEKTKELKKDDKGYLRSEISYGHFYRAIPLASDANPNNITAIFSDGVLKITIEKILDTSARTKKILIRKDKGDKDSQKALKH